MCLRATTVAGAALLLAAGCGGDDEGAGRASSTTGGAGGASTTGGAGGASTTGGGGGTSTSAGGTGTTRGAPATDPRGPDLQLFTLPECSVVPNGALSGADNLTIFVAVRNGGPGRVRRLVPALIVSDAGHRVSSNNAISEGSAFNPFQVDLSPGNYNRTVRFTITVDPENEFVERDEGNNVKVVTVRLPARPTSTTDVPCTSP